MFGYIKHIPYLCNNKQGKDMKAQIGQYFYAPHRNSWGVWQWDMVSENGSMGTFIKDFRSKEEAREFVWQQNGWGKPKSKLN